MVRTTKVSSGTVHYHALATAQNVKFVVFPTDPPRREYGKQSGGSFQPGHGVDEQRARYLEQSVRHVGYMGYPFDCALKTWPRIAQTALKPHNSIEKYSDSSGGNNIPPFLRRILSKNLAACVASCGHFVATAWESALRSTYIIIYL